MPNVLEVIELTDFNNYKIIDLIENVQKITLLKKLFKV